MSSGKTHAVYLRLRELIEKMELPPGTQLSETSLAERLGASRTPVREAIRQLSHEGLISFTPGSGARVAPISLHGVRTLFEFRMILEPAAVRMVTEDGRNRPELLTEFTEIAGELDTLAERIETTPHAELAPPFHRLTERFDLAITAACHNEQLARTIAHQRGQSARLLEVAHSATRRLPGSAREHRRMCRAVLDGNAEEAAATLTEHLSRTREAIIEQLTTGINAGTFDVEIGPTT
ncbi:DNA-binding GntR family transcriptional regulator [Actinopolyspora lacussalsi]|nr:DNA-binding GntR family transcriptional regulator [Actinopolyspora lacussalsi]